MRLTSPDDPGDAHAAISVEPAGTKIAVICGQSRRAGPPAEVVCSNTRSTVWLPEATCREVCTNNVWPYTKPPLWLASTELSDEANATSSTAMFASTV